MRKLALAGALTATLALVTASTTLGVLVSGSLPTAGFTWTSVAGNAVNITGDGIHLKTKGPVGVKTTYSIVPPSPTFQAGWHYHNGPVFVSVTVGTLTFFNSACSTWDISAGQSYIESTGQVLNAMVLPEKNAGVANVEWFTTRLYPDGASDPVPVPAPCTP
jgi:hypothetical protein